MSGVSLAVTPPREPDGTTTSATKPQQEVPLKQQQQQNSMVGGGLSLFSPPVRALVPLLYTVRRIFVVIDWINDVWLNKTLPANAQVKDIAWYWFGRSLAVANLAYFSINLFFFLIPKFLPRAFEMYFRERDEIESKMAEDKRSAAASKPKSSAYKKAT